MIKELAATRLIQVCYKVVTLCDQQIGRDNMKVNFSKEFEMAVSVAGMGLGLMIATGDHAASLTLAEFMDAISARLPPDAQVELKAFTASLANLAQPAESGAAAD